MKTQINVNAMSVTGQSGSGLITIVDMTESQMFNALNQFLHFVTDETWTRWQAEINGGVYGNADEKRYQFLRDSFALKSDDDEEAFKQLAHLTGASFDKAIDEAMRAAA